MDHRVLVPKEVLLQTPSSEDGVSVVTERRLRIYGVELIQRAAKLLRLPQICSVSAAAIFQRFYFRRSLADFDVRTVAPSALLLACKLEEHHRRLRDVILVFHRLEMRASYVVQYAKVPTPALDAAGRDVMKQEIIRVERLILRELGFLLYLLLEHPHKYVIQFVKSMVRGPNERVAELAQIAWSYLNDSTRTVLCCMYAPHQITVASIYLAARDMKIKLPVEPPWWKLFDTELHDLQCIAKIILSLYSQPLARYVKLPPKQDTFLLGLATPFGDTLGPLKSPMSDEDAQGSPRASVDPYMDENQASGAVPQTMLAATKNLPGSFSSADSARPRSRSPKRKVVVQLNQLRTAAALNKSRSFG